MPAQVRGGVPGQMTLWHGQRSLWPSAAQLPSGVPALSCHLSTQTSPSCGSARGCLRSVAFSGEQAGDSSEIISPLLLKCLPPPLWAPPAHLLGITAGRHQGVSPTYSCELMRPPHPNLIQGLTYRAVPDFRAATIVSLTSCPTVPL